MSNIENSRRKPAPEAHFVEPNYPLLPRAESTDASCARYVDEVENNNEFYPYRSLWSRELHGITRFTKVETMIHRETDLYHASRVQWLSGWITHDLTHQGVPLDSPKISRLALHHDDEEIGIGEDLPGDEKDDMTPGQKQELQELEETIIDDLAIRYNPERYQDLYRADHKEVKAKQTLEAQVVNIADKWDGLGQTMHDIRCGNESEKIFQVLQNYRVGKFGQIQKHSLWPQVAKSPYLGLGSFPTDDEVRQMSRIDLSLLENGHDAFWQRVTDPALPAIYRRWLYASLATSGIFGTFPGWKEELKPYQPQPEDYWHLHGGTLILLPNPELP